MHEHVVAAVVRLNEAQALCRLDPLNCSGSHFTSPRCARCALCPHDLRASLIRFQRCLGEGSRFGAFNKQIDYSNGRRLRRSPRNSKRKAISRDQDPSVTAPNSRALMRLARHADDFSGQFGETFSLPARFNVTRIIQFCAPQFSLFETMRAAKKPPNTREVLSDDKPD